MFLEEIADYVRSRSAQARQLWRYNYGDIQLTLSNSNSLTKTGENYVLVCIHKQLLGVFSHVMNGFS